jgi:hypothetical protein
MVYISVSEFNSNQQQTTTDSIGSNAVVLVDQTQVKDESLTRIKPGNFTQSDFNSFLTHPMKIYHATWTGVTASAVVTSDVFSTYLSTASTTTIGEKLSKFNYCHAKLRVKVVVQGQPFAAGQIVFSFVPHVTAGPYATPSGMAQTLNKVNAKIVPHIVVDPSKSETYEILLDPPTPTGFYSIKNTNYGSYRLEAHAYNAIFSGTATSASATICIYASLQAPSFEGLTLVSAPFEDEKKTDRTLSTIASTVSTASTIGSFLFPPFAPFLTAFSTVSGAVGDALFSLGFSKPQYVENQHIVLNRLHDNFSQVDGKSTALVLSSRQSNSLGISDKICGGDHKEMMISTICAKKGFYGTHLIAPAATAGQLVARWPVHPCVSQIVSAGVVAPTPMAGVAIMHEFWSGDLTITFEFVASVFHRLTVLIAWDPNRVADATTPDFEDCIATLQNTTVSISGNTTVDVTIPWKKQQPWAAVGGLHKGILLADFTNEECNGEIYLFVVNPITSNGSTENVQFNTYYSSNNVRFAAPNLHSHLYQVKETAWVSSEFAPVNKVAFGPKSDLSMHFLRSFGEEVTSLKELASKVSLKTIVNVTTAGPIVSPWYTKQIDNYPVPYTDTAQTDVSGWSFFSWISMGFLGYRGGIRYLLHVHNTAADKPVLALHAWVRNYVVDTKFATNVGGSAASFVTNNFNDIAYAIGNRDVCPSLDVVAPMLYPLDFWPTGIRMSEITNALHHYQATGVQAVASGYTYTIGYGAADDGVFHWFVGFPIVNVP